MTAPPAYFKQLELGPMQNFIYLIGDPAAREAAVVDPGWEAERILGTLRDDGYRLARVFITHGHPDHVMSLSGLLDAADVPVHVHAADADALPVRPANLAPTTDGELVRVGAVAVRVMHTPGHTPGSQCLLTDGRLLTGDTLFIKGCGRCDLPGGDPVKLYDSLSAIKALPDETVLYPGHNYAEVPSIALGEEKRASPFLSRPTLEAFLTMLGYA
ncbi:MAG TPA: MBL fold metallo-hydrolase [bacterium]